jgi:RNA polymerase sigma factor (sigma-70 family)
LVWPEYVCVSVIGSTDFSKATDAELLRLTPEDARAFGVLYARFEREVLAFLWARTRRADVAADLAGEVFAAALESVARFDPELGSVRGWLFGIARHQLADAWERGSVENRARQRLGMKPVLVSDKTIERIEALDAAQSGVLGLLEQLPDDQRLAVKGRVVEERDYAELSRSLSCSESVVRQRVSRGLRALRERLEETP